MGIRKREETLHQFEQWGFDERGWSQNTRRRYSRRVRGADAWIAKELGGSIIWAGPHDLKKYLWSTSPNALNRNNIRQALVAFGAFLVAQGWIEVNPAMALPRLPQPRAIPKALDQAACRRVAVTAKALHPKERALVYLMLYGGLRHSEARLLQWRSVSEDGSWLRIRGKGDKEREVPLNREAQLALLAVRGMGLDPVWCFPSPQRIGCPLSTTSVATILRELGTIAGVPNLHPHMLRHSVATRMLELGTNVREVQEFLGHASLSSTQIYTRVRPVNLRKAVAKLDFLLVPPGEPVPEGVDEVRVLALEEDEGAAEEQVEG